MKWFVYGIGIDEPLMLQQHTGHKYYYHFNQLGSVMSLTDSNGDIVARFEYDVYGEPTAYDDQGEKLENVVVQDNPYLFTGRNFLYILAFCHIIVWVEVKPRRLRRGSPPA